MGKGRPAFTEDTEVAFSVTTTPQLVPSGLHTKGQPCQQPTDGQTPLCRYNSNVITLPSEVLDCWREDHPEEGGTFPEKQMKPLPLWWLKKGEQNLPQRVHGTAGNKIRGEGGGGGGETQSGGCGPFPATLPPSGWVFNFRQVSFFRLTSTTLKLEAHT